MSLLGLCSSNPSTTANLLPNPSVSSSSSSSQASPLIERIPLAVLALTTTYLNTCETLALRRVCSFFNNARIQSDEMLFATTPIHSTVLPVNHSNNALTRLNANQLIYGRAKDIVVWDALKENTSVLKHDHVNYIASLNEDVIAYSTNEHVYATHSLKLSTIKELEDSQGEGPLIARRITSIVFLNSSQIACACFDGHIRTWNVETGHLEGSFPAHTGPVFALATLGQHRLISASADRTLKVWNMEAQKVSPILIGKPPVLDKL